VLEAAEVALAVRVVVLAEIVEGLGLLADRRGGAVMMTGRKREAKGMTFDPNGRAAIEAVLRDERNPGNPIARAVLAKVRDCADRIGERINELGGQPDELAIDEPETVLDAVVWRLAADAGSRETGRELKVTWNS
jgi:hypothetical protein